MYPLFDQEGPIEIHYLFFQGVLVKIIGIEFFSKKTSIKQKANIQQLTKTQNKKNIRVKSNVHVKYGGRVMSVCSEHSCSTQREHIFEVRFYLFLNE